MEPDSDNICVVQTTRRLDATIAGTRKLEPGASEFLDFRLSPSHTNYPDVQPVGHLNNVLNSNGRQYAYFDGEAHVVMKDAMFSNYFVIGMTIKPDSLGTTLFSGKFHMKNADYDNFPHAFGQSFSDNVLESHYTAYKEQTFELYIDDCGAIVVQLGDQKNVAATDDGFAVVGNWASMVLFVLQNPDNPNTTGLVFFSENGSSTTQDIIEVGVALGTNFKSDYYIGSLFGEKNNYIGYMGTVLIANIDFGTDFSAFLSSLGSSCTGCTGYCDFAGSCYADADCGHNQFFTTVCVDCHSSCKNGCTDANACTDVCDDTCDTCNGSNMSDCLTCHKNAHRISQINGTSACECDVGYYGDPAHCTPICQDDHCVVCGGPGLGQCLECVTGFALTNGHLSECALCADFEPQVISAVCPTDGRYAHSDCSCPAGTYFENNSNVDQPQLNCHKCPENCKTCAFSDDGKNCSACDDGYIFWEDTDKCFSYCPTGHVPNGDTCYSGLDVDVDTTTRSEFANLLAMFNFGNDGPRSWTYNGSWDDSDVSTDNGSWTVTAFGGANSLSAQREDPYQTHERGIYFDGKSTYLTLTGLTLPHMFFLSVLVKPMNSGALWSSSKIMDGEVQISTHFGIIGKDVEFEEKEHGGYWRTHSEQVESDEWIALSVQVYYDNHTNTSNIRWYFNDVQEVGENFNWIFVDYPDTQFTHRIGTLERRNTMIHHFKGFMTQFVAVNRQIEDWLGLFSGSEFDLSEYFETTCASGVQGTTCNVCSDSEVGATAVDTCPSNCAPLTYGTACIDCPTHCTKGCDNSGAC